MSRFIIFKDHNQEFVFDLLDDDDKRMIHSIGNSYYTCNNLVHELKNYGSDAKYYFKQQGNKRYSFYIKNSKGKVILQGGMFSSDNLRNEEMTKTINCIKNAVIQDKTIISIPDTINKIRLHVNNFETEKSFLTIGIIASIYACALSFLVIDDFNINIGKFAVLMSLLNIIVYVFLLYFNIKTALNMSIDRYVSKESLRSLNYDFDIYTHQICYLIDINIVYYFAVVYGMIILNSAIAIFFKDVLFSLSFICITLTVPVLILYQLFKYNRQLNTNLKKDTEIINSSLSVALVNLKIFKHDLKGN